MAFRLHRSRPLALLTACRPNQREEPDRPRRGGGFSLGLGIAALVPPSAAVPAAALGLSLPIASEGRDRIDLAFLSRPGRELLVPAARVFRAMAHQVAGGELSDMKHMLPKPIQELWRRVAQPPDWRRVRCHIVSPEATLVERASIDMSPDIAAIAYSSARNRARVGLRTEFAPGPGQIRR